MKSFATLKFRSDSGWWKRPAVREFLVGLVLLGVALFLALGSDSAARRGDSFLGILFALLALLLTAVIALTLVPRLARRVDLSRWLMPSSFKITRAGGFYILAVFLLSLAAINTGNNLLFLILSTLLSAIITSGIAARTSLRSVSVSLQVPENVFEGERISLKVSLRNQKRFWPSFSIFVEDLGQEKSASLTTRIMRLMGGRARRPLKESSKDWSVLRQPAYFPVIPPGEARSELISQTFPRRGKYRLEGYRLSTQFPFGLFKRGERIQAQGEVLVYPSVREISSFFHLLPFLPGRLEGMHLGPGENLYSIRKYQEGESVRIVDWKATAKTGELMAREYAREEESKFCLILDTLVHPTAREHYSQDFEKAVSVAASLAAHFCEEGAELEFLTPYEYVPRGMGPGQLYRILRSLAVVRCELADKGTSADLRSELSGIVEPDELQHILSDKLFKVIITSKPRGSFPSSIWRSSHVVYFDEL